MRKKGLLILLTVVLIAINMVVNLSAVNNITKTASMEIMQFINGGREEFSLVFKDFLDTESPLTNVIAALNELPFWLMYICAVVVKLAICACVLSLRPGAFCQAGGFILYSPLKVLANGLFGYFAFLALIIVFLVSVFGIPVAVFLFMIFWTVTLLGEIGLSLVAGLLLLDSLKLRTGVYACMLLGVVLIEAIRRVPYLGYMVTMVLLPIICTGVVFTLFYEGWGKKVFFELPFWNGPTTGESMRDIVMRGI
jgi:hypothetical protein